MTTAGLRNNSYRPAHHHAHSLHPVNPVPHGTFRRPAPPDQHHTVYSRPSITFQTLNPLPRPLPMNSCKSLAPIGSRLVGSAGDHGSANVHSVANLERVLSAQSITERGKITQALSSFSHLWSYLHSSMSLTHSHLSPLNVCTSTLSISGHLTPESSK